MDVWKNIRPWVLRAAALAGILVVLTIFINLSWFDEELHPDLAQLMPPQDVSMSANAFPLVYGFLAANDRDAEAAGLTIVETLRDRFAAGEDVAIDPATMNEILGGPVAEASWSTLSDSAACNTRFELDCADRLIAGIPQANLNDPRLRTLLERYERILEQQRFEENQEFDVLTPIPPYGRLLTIGKIRLAISFRDRSTAEFLQDVARDVAFWKTVLRDGQSLIAKMIALAALRNDADFLSALIREQELTAAELQSMQQVLTPLTRAERDIGETFLAEMRLALLSQKSMTILLDGPSPLTTLALQDNSTMNEYYLATIQPLRLRAALDASEFYRQGGHLPLSYSVRSIPPPLYNLGGKLILKWASQEMSIQDYISRTHDLDGRIALVLLQAEIALDPDRPIDRVVADSRYRNPYTLEPMDYDRQAGTIGFDCLGNPSDVCAVRL